MKNVLRDLIDDEIVNIIKYSFNSKSNAFELNASTNKFINVKNYVNEFEQKTYYQKIDKLEKKTHKLFNRNRVVRQKNKIKQRYNKNLKIQ